ncbi:metallophosphoesterase family protein [Pseudanabaena mucicola]|uniref:Nuclease SbcCD subunit D n=1 Tax=Pseudanabaena mucicola FACHB-723 TaxID=2692860 RepID=A0ABR7ZST4_9CYAN|nr:exonuclease subunit SbcD [Pseudanabaena mucicola]MBD2186797.1 exonuclease subunit SbcD [Pseudanabaena mucicola FACHB-723]
MRLIHTSDWHLGRKLKGVDRTPEIEAALAEILTYAQEFEVDAVLVAGDIFDVPNPNTEAERVAYEFFYKLNQLSIPSVAIAGNHDSANRIDSLSHLLSLAGVRALGRPRIAAEGGVVNIDTAGGKLCVGAMPFASERRLLAAEDVWHKDDLEQRSDYKSLVTYVLQDLAKGFQNDAVNVMMAHMTIDGAKFTGSEAAFYSGAVYSLSGQSIPSECQYVGLGHIHRPQQVANAAPTYYAGSLIQVDFGEVGEEKGFNLIEVERGRPAQVKFQPLTCQKPLKRVECHLDHLEEHLESHRDYQGYLKFAIAVDTPPIGLADRVRKVCPQAVMVEPKLIVNTSAQTPEVKDYDRFDPIAEFQKFYSDREKNLSPDVMAAFKDLYMEFNDASN